MDWIKAKLRTVSDNVETATAILMEAGVSSIEIEDAADMQHFLKTTQDQWDYVDETLLNKHIEPDNPVYIIFYLTPAETDKLWAVEQKFGDKLHLERVKDEQWANNWKQYYKPFAVGKRFIIKPSWEEYENTQNKLVLQLDPGHIFGTGQHQTTQLCLEQLEEAPLTGKRVLDIGCGSGILTIAALLLGAKEAHAIDTDINAADIVRQNAALNNVSCRVSCGDARDLSAPPYDIIVANIVADVICELSGFAYHALEKGGLFISSGIIRERLDEVIGVLKEVGFAINNIETKDDWVCVVCGRE